MVPKAVEIETEETSEEDFAFLGREFLTWLLWRADVGEAEWDDFTVGFGGRVRLQGIGGDVTDSVHKGRSPAMGVETRAAVGAGRTLREAELRLATEDREWRFTLVADTLDWKSVKLPAVLKESDDDPLAERMTLLEELDEKMTTVFRVFLSERTRPAWARSTVPALRTWLAEGLRADPAFAASIPEPIEILGVDDFKESAVTIKARLKTAPISSGRRAARTGGHTASHGDGMPIAAAADMAPRTPPNMWRATYSGTSAAVTPPKKARARWWLAIQSGTCCVAVASA